MIVLGRGTWTLPTYCIGLFAKSEIGHFAVISSNFSTPVGKLLASRPRPMVTASAFAYTLVSLGYLASFSNQLTKQKQQMFCRCSFTSDCVHCHIFCVDSVQYGFGLRRGNRGYLGIGPAAAALKAVDLHAPSSEEHERMRGGAFFVPAVGA